MKLKFKLPVLIAVLMTFCIPISAYAASYGDFTDISSHWASEALKVGYDDGLISGTSSTTLSPDAPITAAQMITVLCRVLGASKTADISTLGISSDAWYADAAGKALNLGLISNSKSDLDKPISRQSALAMIAKAFCLVPAEPDYSSLTAFSDTSLINAENKGAIAALVSEKYIQGMGGTLNVNSSLSRAEFLTLLFRVAKNFISPSDLKSGTQDGSVLRGGGLLNYISSGNIWFDCSSESITLSSVKLNSVTLRSDELQNLNFFNDSEINELNIALGGGSVTLGSSGSVKIGTLRLVSCDSAAVGTDAGTVEITGSNMPVYLSGKHDKIVISGSGNTVTLSSDVSLSSLKILGDNNSVTVSDRNKNTISSCDELNVQGNGNTLSFNVSSQTSAKITVGGNGNKLGSEYESVSSIGIEGSKCDVNITSHSSVTDFTVSGNGNSAAISSDDSLPVNVYGSSNIIGITSGTQVSSAAVTGSANWLTFSCPNVSNISISGIYNTVNKCLKGTVGMLAMPGNSNAFVLYTGNDMQSAEVSGTGDTLTVNGTAQSVSLDGQNSYLNGSGTVSSLAINAIGCTISVSFVKATDNSKAVNEERVLKLVTLGYQGNYTLKWANEHDYTEADKTTWINAKGYSSSTDYIIWVNLSMQRVNVFQGSVGDWKLVYSCIVGTGATGRDTPIGTWTITYKLLAGWTTSTYTVKPVVGFKQDTGYAFHSRLYYPGTSTLSDASIGYPVSHGCVRMYENDIKYIYDTIPFGTTVVVY